MAGATARPGSPPGTPAWCHGFCQRENKLITIITLHRITSAKTRATTTRRQQHIMRHSLMFVAHELGCSAASVPPNVVANNPSDMTRLIICFIFVLINVSCSKYFVTVEQHNPYKLRNRINLHQKSDNERFQIIDDCKKNWRFRTLTDTLEIRVIQYLPAYRHSLNNLPAMIIGNNNSDTLRILVYDFFEKIDKGKHITIIPDLSTTKMLKSSDEFFEATLLMNRTQTHLSKKKDEDSYYCNIKDTYFGKVKL